MQIGKIIETAYAGFNSRNIDLALSVMHSEVKWPKAFEGGYVKGHEEIRRYWTRQWSEINPNVIPTQISTRPDGKVEVVVDQLVKDLQGKVLFDGKVLHVYTVLDSKLKQMDIEDYKNTL